MYNKSLLMKSGTKITPLFLSSFLSLFLEMFLIRWNPASALGSNLLGATIGGFCEYLTMLWGFQILWLFAIGFYLIAGIFQNRK